MNDTIAAIVRAFRTNGTDHVDMAGLLVKLTKEFEASKPAPAPAPEAKPKRKKSKLFSRDDE